MIAKFIAGLASYYCHENDLSNICRLLCLVNEHFKAKFLRFFFPQMDVSAVVSIEREVTDPRQMGSRVDLYIELQDEAVPYIIEVKINDGNHHFGQYERAFGVSIDRFGYITNYPCSEGLRLGYDMRTWEEFYRYMEEFPDNDALVLGFLEYLKETCNIVIYDRPMNLTGLDTIPCFADTAKCIIEEWRDWVTITSHRIFINRDGVHQAFYFKFAGQREHRDGYALLGLWFQEKPCITLCINSREWLSNRIMENAETMMDGACYCKAPYNDSYWRKDDVFIDMNESALAEFVRSSSYEEQKEILRAFLEEALHRIASCFNYR